MAGLRCVAITALPLAALLLASGSAWGLVVDPGGGQASEQAPPQDPGFAHVGRLGTVSGIYVGGGWVLTASHAGVRDLVLGDRTYPAVADSRVWMEMPGQPGVKSDLALFRVDPAPDLPYLEFQREPPARGSFVLLVGMGLGRGEPFAGTAGYHWLPGRVRRWGSNRISAVGLYSAGPGHRLTRSFRMDFDREGTAHEAQAAKGDSGGAVFLKDGDGNGDGSESEGGNGNGGGGYRLAGVMISIGHGRGQAPNTALYGNLTNAADISQYLPQIEAAMLGTAAASP